MTEHQEAGETQQRFGQACDWFVRLREDAESAELIGEWLEWLDSDPRNQEAFDEARIFWQVTAGVADCVTPRLPSRARRTSWLIAASILLAVAAGALGWFVKSQHSAEYSTLRGESRRFELTDGSHVELAGDSKLRVVLSASIRSIDLMQGEAYFQVAHDKGRPFIVRAGSWHVTAVGTAFNVRTAADRVVVAVEEGVVVVEPRDGDAFSSSLPSNQALLQDRVKRSEMQRVNVHRGEEFAVTLGERHVQLMPIEPNSVASWRSGRLYFAREPLRSVLTSVRAASGVEITLADASLGDLRFTGTVFNDKVSDWVEGLPAIFPVLVRQEGARFVVHEKN